MDTGSQSKIIYIKFGKKLFEDLFLWKHFVNKSSFDMQPMILPTNQPTNRTAFTVNRIFKLDMLISYTVFNFEEGFAQFFSIYR